jgi:hypothetical protein
MKLEKNILIESKILFVTYGGGHVAALLPVMRELQNKSIDYKVLALTTAGQYLKNNHISYFSMKDVVNLVEGYRGSDRVGKILARDAKLNSAVSIQETQAYMGISFHDMVRKFGLKKARSIYATSGRQRFCPVDFFKNWFMSQKPSVVIATSAPRSERAALEAASDLGIPSLCLVDLYAPFEIEWCASPGYASKICVLNDAVAERFLQRGVGRDSLLVTGNPSFDRLSKLDVDRIRRDYRLSMGIKDNDFLVSWMSQPEPERHPFSTAVGDPLLPERIERYLVEGLKERSNFKLVLRRHPSENRPNDFMHNRVFYSDVAQPLDDLLCGSDCVITTGSTVGLEAGLLGIPVIQSMDSIFSKDLPLETLGFARAVDNHLQLWSVIEEIQSKLYNKNRKNHHVKYYSNAGETISLLILQLLNHKSK